MRLLGAELLKYKRTFMAKLVIFIPLFFAAYSLATDYLMPGAYDWNGILVLSFNWWPVAFLPMGFGLFAAMVASQEKKAGRYRVLKAEPLASQRVWLAKIGGMAVISACSSLVLIAGDMVCGLIEGDVPPFRVVVVAAVLCWLATLALIPLQLWVATWAGMLPSIALGVAGSLGGVLLAPTKLWLFCPWSWAIRLMCPTIGVHPNGTILPEGSRLFDASVIPLGLVVSLLALVVFSALTAMWFARRDVK
ncbi:MAG: lantibiotic immunity ABC transporter MutE/EpiE family permease subunit [Peptococcaceae bacterium]|nr:lantibiotic immunity ABC transporter MutE/EpiE family permease subunit [Peptococcaceae bacterium]